MRLAIVDEQVKSDRSPIELPQLTDAESNLVARHLHVLVEIGVISRRRSSDDGRRRYIHLQRSVLADLQPGAALLPVPVVFVCTHNSARSQLAVALWVSTTDTLATSAGTQPASCVHPGAVAAGHRAGLDLSTATPRGLDEVDMTGCLVVTVCDRAHEDLDPRPSWLHWSITDPVATPSKRAFDRTVVELRDRIASLIEIAS